jgi:hypothetical protein
VGVTNLRASIPKTELVAKYLTLRKGISPLPFRNLRDCRTFETLVLEGAKPLVSSLVSAVDVSRQADTFAPVES